MFENANRINLKKLITVKRASGESKFMGFFSLAEVQKTISSLKLDIYLSEKKFLHQWMISTTTGGMVIQTIHRNTEQARLVGFLFLFCILQKKYYLVRRNGKRLKYILTFLCHHLRTKLRGVGFFTNAIFFHISSFGCAILPKYWLFYSRKKYS